MKIHFISIGGSVMHQLAIALHKKGYKVTGADDEIFEPARTNLEKEGLLPAAEGWFPEKITTDIDAVILGMHAKADNPEIARAKELNLPIYSFPEYIFQESKNKTRVVIGGSHGKTTTTAMIMHVLRQADKSFDYLVGARLEGFSQSVNITNAPLIICEGDEYPSSALERVPKFHFLFPHIAVLTGIAWDHINVFPTFDNYLEQFRIFISKIETNGHLIFNSSDKVLNDLINSSKRSDITYHPYAVPSHQITDGVTTVEIEDRKAELSVFGDHNLLNMNAAWEVCRLLGIDATAFLNSIQSFKGAAKRLELIGKNESTVFYRDFAHAPSKVKATIEAVRSQFPDRKVIAVLELHTFSSLSENFMNEYKGSLDKADEGAVFYSNHALQLKRLPALSKAFVRSGFANDRLVILDERNDLESWLDERDYSNSVTVFMSSGNYDGIDLDKIAKLYLYRL